MAAEKAEIGGARASRSFWLKHLHTWHWVSSAICLIGMIAFSVTGVTLNHAADIEAKPQVTVREGALPAPLLALLESAPETGEGALPGEIVDWIAEKLRVDVAGRLAEWSVDEVYVGLPRPGGDAWLTIDRAGGEARYELTDRGAVSFLNDLHKGRNTGVVWSWFIDIFAAACLVFCVTGLFLLHLHAGSRPSTWPLVGLGVAAPAILVILFIH